MEHFYDRIPGWFDYLDIYKRMVEAAPEKATVVEVGSYHGRRGMRLSNHRVMHQWCPAFFGKKT